MKLSPEILSVLIIILNISSSICAMQSGDAALKGELKDTSGNLIISSPVVIKCLETGLVKTTTSDDNGYFYIQNIPPGTYSVFVRVAGFKTFERHALKLNGGQLVELNINLEVGDFQEVVQVEAGERGALVSEEGRLADTFNRHQVSELPLSSRDIYGITKLSAGATAIPGAASSTKVTNSPVITVNGNRYRGNNYVIDGGSVTNPNNTGEPALVPALDSVEEVQVQTSNFTMEYGRGNGSVVNIRTLSGTNGFHGRTWIYHRNAALNARNFFSTRKEQQVFNQFGANFGGPVFKNRTFFFGSYEATRHAVGRPVSFLVETPELRDYVLRTSPNSVAASLLRQFPAPAPLSGTGTKYLDQGDLRDGQTVLVTSAIGRAAGILQDYIRQDQYLARVDHSFNNDLDKISVRWIAEHQRDDGGTSSSPGTQARALRGSRGPFTGFFGNINISHTHTFGRHLNDLRFSTQFIETTRGKEGAVVPEITITGLTAPFGDVFKSSTILRTYELRDTVTFDRGSHLLRFGGELRRIFKGLSVGPPSAGSYTFTSLLNFVRDQPFRQTLTVNPHTGVPSNFDRYFHLYETGLFIQDDWRVNSRLNINLGLRHDYFGTVSEREGRLSSIVLGEGAGFRERLMKARIGRVDRLYSPELLNFSPRVGLAWDIFGDGSTSLRTGFSLAFQPHHGQSISGARALPPDAVQSVIQPSNRIGTRILYGIPVPFNSEFGRGLNEFGGVAVTPGQAPVRITGFVVNPEIKTQYSESWFLNLQRRLPIDLMFEIGYVGTNGINLERIDDINRFRGDLLDGVEDRINPNFGTLLFVTNGVNSSYNAMTMELRRPFSRGLSFQVNYRWSKWIDTSSDTSTGQFQDNSEPGKGAADIDCLRCERARSMFDIPHRFAASIIFAPAFQNRFAKNWQMSAIFSTQSGRPFSVWNGRPFSAGGDYNADGGGGAVGGGFYDRPDAPPDGTVRTTFNRSDFINGLFRAQQFPAPSRGENGTLGRNTFRGPGYTSLDLSLARAFVVKSEKQLQLRVDLYNALNNVNLFLPVGDLSLGTFGKSTQAFEPRVIQGGIKFIF
jgi:hypothetical protein